MLRVCLRLCVRVHVSRCHKFPFHEQSVHSIEDCWLVVSSFVIYGCASLAILRFDKATIAI